MNDYNYILLVDYGHGTRKYTAGKRSPDETLFEGEWNREVGKKIVDGMRGLGVEVIEVVPEDEDIPLQKRCARVNKVVRDNPDKKCRFLSVHINAAPASSSPKGDGWVDNASGCSVWVSNNCSPESVKMAHCYYDVVKEFGLKGNRSAPKEGVWRANFTVLAGTLCPAMLTENLFMTNHKEVEFLKSEEGKETIANMHICALCKYMGLPYALVTAEREK
jgi:N-acetylmuramoyl-L-alanine amidase